MLKSDSINFEDKTDRRGCREVLWSESVDRCSSVRELRQ